MIDTDDTPSEITLRVMRDRDTHDGSIYDERKRLSAENDELRARIEQLEAAVDAWFTAHDEYHQASIAYNKRLELVRAEREQRGNYTMNCHQEYAALSTAQKAALAADETLYAALSDQQLRDDPK